MNPPHGSVRLEDDGKTLVITTQVKRGQVMQPLVRRFTVSDCRPDPAVASPAFELAGEHGPVYHVALREFGPTCDCQNSEIREKYGSPTHCKHVRAMQAVGLLPKG